MVRPPTDPAAGIGGLRTLGTGAAQAAAGDHTQAVAKGGTGADQSAIAKGGLLVGLSAGAIGIKAVGADALYLKANSAVAGGVEWAAAAGSLDITGLTAADPAIGDEIPEYNIAAGANRKVTCKKLGGFLNIGVSELRLTLATGTPVTSTDQLAKGTIYLTPYVGNRIRIYDGTRWNLYQTAEVSLALTVTSGKNYDVFIYDNAGTLTLELSAAWTNDTTRADALTTQDGVQVKSGATTRLWVGTIRASAANQCEDSAAKRFVWNCYNQIRRNMRVVDTTSFWTYTIATWRQANAADGNKLAWVTGLASAQVSAMVIEAVQNTLGSLVELSNGIGIDSITIDSSQVRTPGFVTSADVITQIATYDGYPGVGYHYAAWLERSNASGISYWYGQYAAHVYQQCGMFGSIFA